ncbi:NAD-dependent epimerase/dehydratase family protein [Salinibacterium sp. G-O1]|uniref:NAD-dependent epimerase/dehydratase family protein n=1 Tax=Salinibacterium sp. G-O1 TaxID=3046208 RepID=UPI0024B9F654|nr:NAD-dependent epimerase/dehydratase family protein [Salinibacterium sp. G-O1]MDJ0334097.1 NAD-dependent epimerase/dehydratase family protein [Salinibacterium sp. G-O1]
MTETHVVLGTGGVGTALATALVARGRSVRSVNRSGERGILPAAVEVIAGDVSDPAFAASATRGAAVTYQVTQPRYTRWEEEFPALQAAVLDACATNGSRLVLADNLYMYGDADGATITEDSPQHPHTKKGRVRKAMADAALAAHAEGRLEVAISRPSNYFGPGYALMQNMVFAKAIAGGPMQWLGAKDQPHSFSFVPDVGRAMADLGTSDDAWGQVWIPPVTHPITVAEFSQQIWEAAGQTGRAKVQAINGFGLKALALVMPMLKESLEMMYEFEKPWTVSSAKFEARFGWSATPLAQTIAESLAAAR